MGENVHGQLACRACFTGVGTADSVSDHAGHRLVNDPGYWGAPDPVVLVLGHSKGRNQQRAAAKGFDAVAFAGVRDRLKAVLDRIGVPTGEGAFDDRFTVGETDVGFASLVRCGLSTHDGRTSPSPIVRAMRSSIADGWVRTCMQRWLTDLNPRLRLVVLLGLTDGYVAAVTARLRDLHPATFRPENPTTFHAADVVWTFVQHPSRQAVTSFPAWVGDEPLDKRSSAVAAVRLALGPVHHQVDPSARATPGSAPPQPRSRRTVGEQGPTPLAAAIEAYLDEDLNLVRHGALIPRNKKMSDWRTSGGTVFAYERQHAALWTPDRRQLCELTPAVAHVHYPAADLEIVGSDGRVRYGRHSAPKTIRELRHADLIRFAPATMAEAVRIVTTLLRS